MKLITCILVSCMLALTLPHPATADVTDPEEGYNLMKTIFFLPAATLQLIVFDMPGGFLSLFNPARKKLNQSEKALNNVKWQTRYQAVNNLGTAKKEKAYQLLIQELTDNQVIVSARAFELLKKAKKEDVIPLLIKNLESRDPWTRKLSADLLGYYNDHEVMKQLVFLTNDSHREVQLAALLALEKLSGEQLIFDYFPVGTENQPHESIQTWWYMRGKTIKNLGKD